MAHILGTHPVTGVNRLSGDDAIRLFVVSAGKTLTLTNITLEHGYNTGSGGCLEVYGSLVALTTWEGDQRICDNATGATHPPFTVGPNR